MVVDNFGVSLSRGTFWPWHPFSCEKWSLLCADNQLTNQLTEEEEDDHEKKEKRIGEYVVDDFFNIFF